MLKPRDKRRSSGSRSRVGSERMEPKHNLLRHNRTIAREIQSTRLNGNHVNRMSATSRRQHWGVHFKANHAFFGYSDLGRLQPV